MAPIVVAMRARPRLAPLLLAAASDIQPIDDALAPLGLAPDHRLVLDTEQALPALMAEATGSSLDPLLQLIAPDLVLVQGDTAGTFAAACSADCLGIPVGHVMADAQHGGDGNHIAIDRISTLLFAPDAQAMARLAADPRVSGACHLVGDSRTAAGSSGIVTVIENYRDAENVT